MRLIVVLACLLGSLSAHAQAVFKIEVGKDYRTYSGQDLQRRVWELERAVWQLQQRVFELETTQPQAPVADSWLCTVSAMGVDYPGTGGSKAVATAAAIKACTQANGGDGFFCKVKKCEE